MNIELSGAKTDVVKLKARTNLLFALLSHARQEIERHKSVFQDHVKRRDERIAQLDNDVKNRNDRISELDNDILLRDLRINELENDLKRLSTQLQDLKVAEANFKGTLAGITQSTSWRITAPLRAIGRAIKREP